MGIFPLIYFLEHVIIIRTFSRMTNNYYDLNNENRNKNDNFFSEKEQLFLEGLDENSELIDTMK